MLSDFRILFLIMNRSLSAFDVTFLLLLTLACSVWSKKPNIVIMITDDQDVLLNSMEVMHHTHNELIQQGVEFANAFTTTPMCCPSRSTMLTGLYTHNHHVYTNNDNCSSTLWRKQFESRSYATYLNNSGYNTGYFGKYLNEYNGSYIPAGWKYWMGLIKNSKYYNYAVNHNSQKELHGDDYAKDYLTDLVTNRSMEFFRDSKTERPEDPVLVAISFPAPHGPQDGAPQYQHLYSNITTHMTGSFDHAPNPDKHWIIQRVKERMDDTQRHFSQLLQQKRLQTLLSVDDNIKKFVDMLQEMNELENTYILYLSDHGYHIGQFGIPKGKSMPYDFDIRIPLILRGPGISPGVRMTKIALNIDIAPTILGMAGVPIPSHMDGRNLLDLFNTSILQEEPWRDSFLVERGKMPRDRAHLVKPKLARKDKKIDRLKKVCAGINYKYPCDPGQFWTCATDNDDKVRLQKCKNDKKVGYRENTRKKLCPCVDTSYSMESEIQEQSGIDSSLHVPLRCGRTSGKSARRKQPSKRNSWKRGNELKILGAFNKIRKRGPHNRNAYKRSKRDTPREYEGNTRNRSGNDHNDRSMILTSQCRLYMPNFEIRCLESLYNNPHEWVKHMGHLARSLKTLQTKMKYMKTLRSCLNTYDSSVRPGKNPVRKCECASTESKSRRIKSGQNGNFSHPLITIENNEQEDMDFYEKLREYNEQKSTQKLLKEMRHEKLVKKARAEERGRYRVNKCGDKGLMCFKQMQSSWTVPPKWDMDERCYCTNAVNNTYWCVRIINDETNVLYCQFITGFIEYYDLNDDPDQLYNSGNNLESEYHDKLHQELAQLRSCKGKRNCTISRENSSFSIPRTTERPGTDLQHTEQNLEEADELVTDQASQKAEAEHSGRSDQIIGHSRKRPKQRQNAKTNKKAKTIGKRKKKTQETIQTNEKETHLEKPVQISKQYGRHRIRSRRPKYKKTQKNSRPKKNRKRKFSQ